ncbi:MAG: hypothetical protein AAGL89_13065 [Pseudomonadota bacterium]
MTHPTGGSSEDEQIAAERIEEARQLYRSTKQVVKNILHDLEHGEFADLSITNKMIGQLTTVLADLGKREADFDERFNAKLPKGDIDFDQLRRDIGCRLARIRECCREE